MEDLEFFKKVYNALMDFKVGMDASDKDTKKEAILKIEKLCEMKK